MTADRRQRYFVWPSLAHQARHFAAEVAALCRQLFEAFKTGLKLVVFGYFCIYRAELAMPMAFGAANGAGIILGIQRVSFLVHKPRFDNRRRTDHDRDKTKEPCARDNYDQRDKSLFHVQGCFYSLEKQKAFG